MRTNTFLRLKPGKAHENPAMCGECGGECCIRGPGTCLPKDFAEPLAESVAAALRSGMFRVVQREGVLYVTPATVATAGRAFDVSDATCALWRPGAGCSLAKEQRPSECRDLVPYFEEVGLAIGYRCQTAAGPEAYVRAWKPRQRDLVQALRAVGGHVPAFAEAAAGEA